MQASQIQAAPLLQMGAMYFYRHDPTIHSPVLVKAGAGEQVTGYSYAKDMELSYAAEDLIDAGQMAEETITQLREQRTPFWQEIVAARIRCMAATISALQHQGAAREAMVVGRIKAVVSTIEKQRPR